MESVTLDPEHLNDTDEAILDALRDGRATPQHLADRIEITRPYASNKLTRLVEHGHVEKVAPGLYELANDPRDGHDAGKSDLRGRLRDALEDRDQAQARADRLADELAACQEQLAGCRDRLGSDTDIDALRRALDDVEAAAERGNGNGLQEALQRARQAIGDSQ